MKKITIQTLLFLFLLVNISYADMYYVLIEKNGFVEKGKEAGHNATGDVISVQKDKPTPTELASLKVIRADLTKEEAYQLIEREYADDKQEVTLRARKRKLDIESMTEIKQEQLVEKNTLLQHLSVKPAISVSR